MSTYNNNKTGFRLQIEHRRGYSTLIFTSSSQSVDDLATPIPIKVFHNLNNNNNNETVISYNKILRNKAGIYCFINTVNNKRYICSAKDLYLRLIEHQIKNLILLYKVLF